MGKISLRSQFHPETTTVSNVFIDKYMPAANGTYVKVYLYLLRRLNCGDDLSIDRIAEELDETEKDIKRAFSYWEKQKLLQIEQDENLAASSISILDFQDSRAGAESAAAKEPAGEAPPLPQAGHIKPDYTKEQIEVLVEIDEIKWLMHSLEQYLERLLKPSDIQLILYLYEGLGFSAELILYLYEYCISNHKKSSHYIEAVAISWANDGIDTVEKAEEASQQYNAGIQTVCRTFGIDRKLGSIEKQYITKWFQTYGLQAEIVGEALGRTLLATGKPDFKYADKILTNWHRKNVKERKDLEALDLEHQNRQAKPAAPQAQAQAQPNNRFNAFPQRSHSSEYYDSLEKHLLNKG